MVLPEPACLIDIGLRAGPVPQYNPPDVCAGKIADRFFGGESDRLFGCRQCSLSIVRGDVVGALALTDDRVRQESPRRGIAEIKGHRPLQVFQGASDALGRCATEEQMTTQQVLSVG